MLHNRHELTGHKLGVVGVSMDATGQVGVTSSLDSTIRVWDLEQGSLRKMIDAGPVNAYAVAINPGNANEVPPAVTKYHSENYVRVWISTNSKL